MNRLRLLLWMPWVASAKYARLVAVLAVGVGLLAAVGIAVAGATHAYAHWSHAFILVAGATIWWLWGSYLGANLQLARDARDLRLPRIAHGADLSLLLFAMLSIAPPALVCLLPGASPALAIEVFLTAAACGLAYMLLPFYLGLPMVMAIVILVMTHGLDMPAMTWWTLIVVLVPFDVWRWWRLRTAASVQREGWNAAAVFYCYQQDSIRNGGWINFAQVFLRNRLTAPMALDMRGNGSARPVQSLRLALGGLGMPKPLSARVRDLTHLLVYVVGIPLLFLAPQLFVPRPGIGSADMIRLEWISPLLNFCCVFSCIIVVFAFAGRCRVLWRKPDAELSLLALLPGLGNPEHAKQRVVCALLAPAGVFLAMTAVVLWIGAFGIHANAWAFVSIGLCCVATFALVVTVTFTSLAGKFLDTAAYVLFYLGLISLSVMSLDFSLPMEYHGPHPEFIGHPPLWLLALWAIYLCVLGLLAWNGWHALRKRPHAFLANAS